MPGKSERMPLEIRDFWAANEDVLSCTSYRLLLLDLDLNDL